MRRETSEEEKIQLVYELFQNMKKHHSFRDEEDKERKLIKLALCIDQNIDKDVYFD